MIMPEIFNKNLEQKRGALHPPNKNKKKIRFGFLVKIHLLENSRVVGFMLKKLLAYFEMLFVPHALQCVDGCFFAFYRI